MPRRLFAALAVFVCLGLLWPAAASANMEVRLEKKVVDDIGRGDIDALTGYLLADGNPGARDNTGQPLLVIAARANRLDMVQLLLRHNARPDQIDDLGNTALLWAAREGHREVAQVLLDAGADLEVPNRQGLTPLMAAVRTGSLPLVRLLVAAGADPRASDYTGRDAFGWAEGPRGPLLVNELNKAAR